MSNSSQPAGMGRVKFGRGAQSSDDVGRPAADPRTADVERPIGTAAGGLSNGGDGGPRNLFGNSENQRSRQGDLNLRRTQHDRHSQDFSAHNDSHRGGHSEDRNNSSGHSGSTARPCYMDGNRDEPNNRTEPNHHRTEPNQRNFYDHRVTGHGQDEQRRPNDHFRGLQVAPPIDEHQKKSDEARKICKENAMNLTKTLFESRDMSDVVIVAGDHLEVRAHKVVLALRSPFFKAFFSNEDISEEEKQRFTVTGDFSGEVVEIFLELLYTGQSAKFDEKNSCDGEFQKSVFLLACRFQVEDLKTLAALKLTQEINSENFVKLLILADEEKSQVMKDKIMDFFVKNRKNVIDQEDWKKIREDHSSLYISVLELLAKI